MKWPRTFHLPWSLGPSSDDKVLTSIAHFLGKEVIITEKLDGENTSLHRDQIHARSESSNHHLSRNWIKNLWAGICQDIPDEFQIVGENLFACHSIFYPRLTTYFYGFGIIDKSRDVLLSVDDTLEYLKLLGLEYAPILYRGIFLEEFEVPKQSAFGPEIEGYVVRVVEEISVELFSLSVAKYVRKGHVQTDEHWSKNWQKNELAI